jgi:SAM-dependent methyltransferase
MREPVSDYPLGTTDVEIVRLLCQAELFHNPPTKRLFQEAGIGLGMAVLDVGTGPGDVALLAGDLVGPKGSVVGIDRTPNFVEVARERARQANMHWLDFQEANLDDELPVDGPFDAIVGRSVLAYLKDPEALLAGLSMKLRTGGVLTFREFDWTHGFQASEPSTALAELKGYVDTLLALPPKLLGVDLFLGNQALRLSESDWSFFADGAVGRDHRWRTRVAWLGLPRGPGSGGTSGRLSGRVTPKFLETLIRGNSSSESAMIWFRTMGCFSSASTSACSPASNRTTKPSP